MGKSGRSRCFRKAETDSSNLSSSTKFVEGPWPIVGIGIRVRLRNGCLRASEIESLVGYHFYRVVAESVYAPHLKRGGFGLVSSTLTYSTILLPDSVIGSTRLFESRRERSNRSRASILLDKLVVQCNLNRSDPPKGGDHYRYGWGCP